MWVFGLWQLVMFPDSKVHGANIGPTRVMSAPGKAHVGPMDLAIWVTNEMLWLQNIHQSYFQKCRLWERDGEMSQIGFLYLNYRDMYLNGVLRNKILKGDTAACYET